MSNVDLFKFWVEQGWKYRLRHNPYMRENLQDYRLRLKTEYEVITTVSDGVFVDYFLMVSDLVRWAKDHNIVVGPGRGSAASSLVSYLLRITEIDPLQYPMLFERFISADRTDYPDIDIDFEDTRRAEVVEYTKSKYGSDHVANILTFTKYRGRNSLDDIARVYHVPEWKIDNVKGKLVERNEGHPRFADTLQDTFDTYNDIAELVRTTPELAYAPELEGNYRNSSFHPAGVVISSVPLNSICATYVKQSGKEHGFGVAYDKKDSEYLGLLKIDFLSLTTLSGIAATLDAIGMNITDLYNLPLDDPKVYEHFCKGDVLGIFQFEGQATKRVLKIMQPTKFLELSDVNALSRPGGDDTAYFANRKRGTAVWNHPILLEHLGWTHGTIVYQEQILLILRDLGNFAPAETNSIRKAISGKLDQSVFNAYSEQFVDGAATHGMERSDALQVWSKIVASADYSFNISHSVSYSLIAYWQMWLKVYHPEFYLGQLLKCPEDEVGLDRRRRLIVEAQARGIPVCPPNLLASEATWSLKGGVLYAGWTAIKGVGPRMAENIVAWRDDLDTTSGLGWDALLAIPGIGPGRVGVIRQFCEGDDPFGVETVRRTLNTVRKEFDCNEFAGIPSPTHRSIDLVQPDELVVLLGILKGKVYKDTVEQRLKYGPSGATRESVLDSLEDPHLVKYASLTVVDEYDEPVRIRISRKQFPRYQGLIADAKVNRDIVLVKGYVSDFGGTAIQTKELYVITPEGN